MATYRDLITADVPTRIAAALVGIPRATATRKPQTMPLPAPAVVPANKLGPLERARILALVNSPRFVDLPPIRNLRPAARRRRVSRLDLHDLPDP